MKTKYATEIGRIVIRDIGDFLSENHHIYHQKQFQYRTLFMRDKKIYRRCFSLLKDAIDYRDAALKVSPTPKVRGYARGGNTKKGHDRFNISVDYSDTYRVILQTEFGKIRKSFNTIERARAWRDNEIKNRGVVETEKLTPSFSQSYSDISDKSLVFADSDNIRDKFDALDFSGDEWEEVR